jgi:signal transduction histidine kinase
MWLLHLAALTLLSVVQAYPVLLLHIGGAEARTLIFMIALALFVGAKAATGRPWLVLLAHLVAGGATLFWYASRPPQPALLAYIDAYRAWVATNLVGVIALALAVAGAVRRHPTDGNRLALAGSMLGIGFWADGLLPFGTTVFPVPFTQCVYVASLLVAWYLSKYGGRDSVLATRSPGWAPSTGFEGVSGFGPSSDLALAAVATERRRIAQDLHDNIGSQIVNILASLGSEGSRVHNPLALSLEQCLLDLKMTVDAIDGADDSVPEALGRLRQRLQHSLDTQGIHMAWKVQLCEELEAAQGPVALQVLRIAQECLTNVIRHSRASAVEVVCRFAAERNHVILEVRDNGCGIARKSRDRVGRGLEGMRRRAESVGGALVISSKVGVGTRVRLTVPFERQWSAESPNAYRADSMRST